MWNPIQMFLSNHTDFFEYRRLLKLRFFCNPFMLRENSFYGNLQAVRNSGGLGFGSRIEHGVFFAENLDLDSEGAFTPSTISFFCLRRIYTFSERRRRLVLRFIEKKGLNMDVYAIGPYIHYAKHFLPANKIVDIKNRLGRVLLVYPQHSIEDVSYSYDAEVVISRINQMRRDYDSVLVSLYWVDILHGIAPTYEAAGFTVVCAGRREDANFLSRQKDLISVADRVLSNSVGTHIGYAIALGKPCTLFRQSVKISSADNVNPLRQEVFQKNIDMFYSAFDGVSSAITPKQQELVDEFFGRCRP